MPRDDRGEDIDVHLVKLTRSSFEYQGVLQRLQQTVSSSLTIKSVQRIQNPYLYQAYQLRKQKMDRDNPQANNERQLFHGTNSDNVEKINTQGFDRSFSGSAHGEGFKVMVRIVISFLPSLKFTIFICLSLLAMTSTVLILAVCRTPVSVKRPCCPWVLVGQWIQRPPHVREVMGSIFVGDSDFLVPRSYHVDQSIFHISLPSLKFTIFIRLSLVPVPFREYEYGLFLTSCTSFTHIIPSSLSELILSNLSKRRETNLSLDQRISFVMVDIFIIAMLSLLKIPIGRLNKIWVCVCIG